ncbi:MAG: hypothetical protein IJX77_10445 [Ruminococcus sp.]|nr:hypothetical protein [Ruminococcus sp.]
MADNGGCVLLDTRAFDEFINQKETLVRRYDAINTKYDKLVSDLLDDWSGRGAQAFASDAEKVKANISGIYDILKIMCDTLTDCKEIFSECDRSLGEYNRNPGV